MQLRFAVFAGFVIQGQLLIAATLSVGPGKMYALPSAAIAAAVDGDTIRISTDGNYQNDIALNHKSNLTIEGVGSGRAKIKTDGRVYGRKGIWVFAQGASNLTIKNIEFEGARLPDADSANGAGLRAEGRNLTVTNCRFFNNQDGILGGMGVTTIERCEFDHNGLTDQTHNLYIGDQAGTLIFRYNYSHDSQVGHLLKSRAAVNIIEYNRLSDDSGAGSYELDLPNGGFANIVGNLIQQSAASQNATILAYGEEGVVNPKLELNIINNTFINDRSSGTFINAKKLPKGFKLTAKNNIFAGPGNTISMSGGSPNTGGNVITTITKAGFTDAARFDFSLTKNSPAIGAAVDPGCDSDGKSLAPVGIYVHPLSGKPRPDRSRSNAGAF